MEQTTEIFDTLNTYKDVLGLDLKITDRYFKIHRTTIEMLSDRRYEISAKELSSTRSLEGFLRFLYEKKIAEDNVFLQLMVDELIKQGFIRDEEDNIEVFVTERIPELVKRLNPRQISETIEELFETTDKLVRNLEDVVKDKISSRNLRKSVEFLNQIYTRTTGDQIQKIYVYYFYNTETKKKDEAKLRIADVVTKISSVQKDEPDVKDILFIAEIKLNTLMIEDIKKYKEKMKIEIFMGDHLLFNLTKHFLVPKHHLMTDQEQKEFLKDKEIGLVDRLPKIYDNDPVSRYYGAKVGQIFRITRESLSDDTMVKTSEFYRYVVPEMKK
jgi:hypothetical protein